MRYEGALLKFPVSLSDPVGREVQNQVKTRARLKLKSLLVLYARVMSPLTPFAGFNLASNITGPVRYICVAAPRPIFASTPSIGAITHITQAMHRPSPWP
jgi:hypothetical protein